MQTRMAQTGTDRARRRILSLGVSDTSAVQRAAKATKDHRTQAFAEARVEGFALQPTDARKLAHDRTV
jgi:acyl-CoA synthetase (NDP forming)